MSEIASLTLANTGPSSLVFNSPNGAPIIEYHYAPDGDRIVLHRTDDQAANEFLDTIIFIAGKRGIKAELA